MSARVASIVIVGGGTAGWITAGTLAAQWRNKGITVTLVESPNVPIIGVGEGTWPTMRNTLMNMGIRETDFVRACNVGFKQGWKYVQWSTGDDDDFYYHPLTPPHGYNDVNLAPYWSRFSADLSFSQAVCPQERICEMGLAPKQITTPEYADVANYAYHLDAGAFSEFLKKHCVENLGVRHVLDDVVQINAAENGDVVSVATTHHGNLSGELFVDCTGFKSILLGQHFGAPFKSCKDTLFADTAVTALVPYPNEQSDIVAPTLSTAQEAGWVWDIGLTTRRGVGYVYSSDHSTDDQAEKRLRDYIRPSCPFVDDLATRKISFDPGHREVFWKQNVVAIGLSAGFIEPLEASALLLIEISAMMLADQLPANRATMDIVARRFNKTLLYHWDRIVDFLKLHYVLSQRTDNEFWIDNRNDNSIPDSLKELLLLWRYHSPRQDDFDRSREIYTAASYQFVLYGMGFKTELRSGEDSEQSRKQAAQYFDANQEQIQLLMNALPSHRELLNKIHKFGMQRI